MEVIDDDSQSIDHPLCLMIGNFDGVHLGHQAIIARARSLAGSRLKTAVLSFAPHPLKVLKPEQAPLLLQTPAQKRALLRWRDVDYYIEQTFDAALYKLSPEAFVAKLHQRLHFEHLLVGFNFRFGYQRTGDTQTLKELGVKFGFQTEVIEAFEDDIGPISSSRIRGLVTDGHTEEAARLLGRAYFLEGSVGPGDKLGRKLQTPTANLVVYNELKPRFGVYASWCRVSDDWYRAITNIGLAPTVARNEVRCETHLFDFSGSLYDRHIAVTLDAFIRPERKFELLDELKNQIQIDIGQRLAMADLDPPDLPFVPCL